MLGQVHVIGPAVAAGRLGGVPGQVVLAACAAPHGKADAAVAADSVQLDGHGAAVGRYLRGDGIRRRELGHLGGGVGHQLAAAVHMDEVGAGAVVLGQVHVIGPAAAARGLGSVPGQIVLTACAAPHGKADAAVAVSSIQPHRHGAVIGGHLGSDTVRSREPGHLGGGIADEPVLAGVGGIGVNEVGTGAVVVHQGHRIGPLTTAVLLGSVPGQIILSVRAAPHSETHVGVGVAVACVHGHRHGAALTVHHSGYGVALGGGAGAMGRAAVAADVSYLAGADAGAGVALDHIRMAHGVGILEGQAAQQLAVDAVVIHMDQVAAHHIVLAHRHPDGVGAVAVGGGIVPHQVVLAVLLAPGSGHDVAVIPALAGGRRDGDHDLLLVGGHTAPDQLIQTAIRTELVPGSADQAAAGVHNAEVIAQVGGLEVIGGVADVLPAGGDAAIFKVQGLAVVALDKARGAADHHAVVKDELLAVQGHLSVVGHTVLVKAIHLRVDDEPAGVPGVVVAIHPQAGGLIPGPAGIARVLQLHGLAAEGAYQLAVPGIHSFAGEVVALIAAHAGRDPHGVGIHQGLGALGADRVGADGHSVRGGLHGQVQRVVLLGHLGKVEVRIIDGLVLGAAGLFTQVAADVVQHALAVGGGQTAVLSGLGHRLAILQHHGAGIAVVVAGEHHVDPGGLGGCGNITVKRLAAAVGIGIVCGLVNGQHLPGAAGLGRILDQPLAGVLQVGGKVDDRHIHIAVLHGVIQLVGQRPQAGGVAAGQVAVIFMVAHDLHHGNVGVVLGEYIQNFVPLDQVAAVVHKVAGLDTEVHGLAVDVGGDGVHQADLLLIALHDAGELGIADDKEAGGGRAGLAGGEGHVFRPPAAVAHTVNVGGAGLQSGQGHGTDIGGVAGGGELTQSDLALGPGGEGALEAVLFAVLNHGLGLRGQGVGHPGDVLAALGIGGGVELHEAGHTIGAAAGPAGDDDRFKGTVAVLPGGDAGTGAGGELVEVVGADLAGGVGGSDAGVAHIQVHTGGCPAVNILHIQLGRARALHHNVGGNGVVALHGQPQAAGGGGIGDTVTGVGHSDGNGQAVQCRDPGGHGHSEGEQVLPGRAGTVHVHGDGLFRGGAAGSRAGALKALAVAQGSAGVERALAAVFVGVKQVHVAVHDVRGDGIDLPCIGGGHVDHIVLAHQRIGRRVQSQRGDGGTTLDGKGTGDAGAVAEAVHDLHLDAVAAIGQGHGAGNGLVGVGKVLDVLAVDGDDRVFGGHTGAVLALGIIIPGKELQLIVRQHGGTVLSQLRQVRVAGNGGAAAADRGDDGVLQVVSRGAIHRADVVHIQASGSPGAAGDLVAVHVAGATLDDDGPQQHLAGGDLQGMVFHVLGLVIHAAQISLHILPAGPVDAGVLGGGVHGLACGVDGGSLQVQQAGGNILLPVPIGHAGAEPVVGRALRGVDPHAQGGGTALDDHVLAAVAQVFVGVIGAGDLRIIVMILQRLLAEAHGTLVGSYAAGIHIPRALLGGGDGAHIVLIAHGAEQGSGVLGAVPAIGCAGGVAVPFRVAADKVGACQAEIGNGPVGDVQAVGILADLTGHAEARVADAGQIMGAVTGKAIQVAPHGVGTHVHAGLGALVLKVQKDGGHLADLHGDGIGKLLAVCLGIGDSDLCFTGLAGLGGSMELIVHDGADVGGGGALGQRPDGPGKVAVVIVDIPQAAFDGEAQVAGLVIVQGQGLAGEGHLIGLGDGDGGGAHILTLIGQADPHIAHIALGGGKHTGGGVDPSGSGSIQHPGQAAFRQVGRAACGVSAQGREGHPAAGGIKLVLGAHGRVVKIAVKAGGGHHQQGVGHGALQAVTGAVANHQLVGALITGCHGGGAAAVQINSGDAAGILQETGHFIHAHTDGHGLLSAVGLKEYHGAVGPYAHAVAGHAVALVQAGNNLAVLHQHIGTGDGLHHVGGVAARLADHGGAVLQNGKEGLITGFYQVALHNEVAGGRAGLHVVVVGVGSQYHAALGIRGPSVGGGLGGGLGHLPLEPAAADHSLALGSGAAVVVIAGVAGLQGHILAQVDLRKVAHHLAAVDVAHDHLFQGHAAGHGILGAGDGSKPGGIAGHGIRLGQLCVRFCGVAGLRLRNGSVRLRLLEPGGPGLGHDQTHHHHQRQKQR